jgi:nucleoside-diphosphate-sugar epimerase
MYSKDIRKENKSDLRGVPKLRHLIIGGSGFIGSHLNRYLKRSHSLSELWSPKRANLDLTNIDQTISALDKFRPQIIYNLAGLATISPTPPQELFLHNTLTVYNLLTSVSSLQLKARVITCSSSYIYSTQAKSPINEYAHIAPANLYAVSKVAAEHIANLFPNIDIVIARIFNATGRNQSVDFLLPKLVRASKKRDKTITLRGKNDSRDFVDVRDICRMFELLAVAPKPPKIVNFCNEKPHTIMEVVETLRTLSGWNPTIEWSDTGIVPSTIYGDNSQITQLGYAQKYHVKDTLKWMLLNIKDT